MDIQTIEKFCRNKANEFGFDLGDCEFKLNGRLTRTLGRCWYGDTRDTVKKIEFSRLFFENAKDSEIYDVALHELAHGLVWLETGEPHGHDKEFRKMCARIGTDNDRAVVNHNIRYKKSEDTIFKYTVTCGECGSIFHRSRKSKLITNPELYRCKCGGHLTVRQNF